jgi:hypothetical protein
MEWLYIILGWLFGLLTQPIATRIERGYKKGDFKIAVDSELKNLAIVLASLVYRIATHSGTLDKETFKWVHEIYKKYNPDEQLPDATVLLEASEDIYSQYAASKKAAENVSLNLKVYSTPLLDAIIENLSIFDTKYQRDILKLKTQLDILAQEIESNMQLFYLTFDPSSMAINKATINKNLNDGYGNIQKKSKEIVELIDKFLEGSKE